MGWDRQEIAVVSDRTGDGMGCAGNSVYFNHRFKYIFYLESIRPIRTAENFEAVIWATGFSNKHGGIVGL